MNLTFNLLMRGFAPATADDAILESSLNGSKRVGLGVAQKWLGVCLYSTSYVFKGFLLMGKCELGTFSMH